MQWLVVLAVLSWIISAYVKAQKKRKRVTLSKLLEALQEQREHLQTDELPDEDEEVVPANGVVDAVGRPEHQEYAETLRYEANQQAAAARETGSLGAEPIRAESGEAEGVYTGSLAGGGVDYSRWSGVLDRVDVPSASAEPEESYQFTPRPRGSRA